MQATGRNTSSIRPPWSGEVDQHAWQLAPGQTMSSLKLLLVPTLSEIGPFQQTTALVALVAHLNITANYQVIR